MKRSGLLAAVLLVTLLPLGTPAVARLVVPPVNTEPPTVSGEPVYRGRVTADPGVWTGDTSLTHTYQWLRDDRRIRGATSARYRAQLRDVGSRLSVVVTATDEAGGTGVASSTPTPVVRRAELVLQRRPSVSGVQRYTRRLTGDRGSWRPRGVRTSYQWLRDGRRIRGATGLRLRLSHLDVGHRVQLQVTARRDGYRPATAVSGRRPAVDHRVPVRRTVRYRFETRGRITADLATFRRQVAETFADPRGWRSAGVRFQRVDRGGGMSVVLAQASTVPGFSPVCSAQWSCRVGRYVVINQTRWLHASPSWNRAGQPLRGYRHMVLNHESGHWLGHGHLGCSGRGRLAPVMMQQSKGLDGCRHNPWPLPSELWSRR